MTQQPRFKLLCHLFLLGMGVEDSKYTFIDLFSGCGGLSEGFLQSGRFEGLAHVEWELPMVNTLRHRLETKWNHSKEDAEKRVVHFDIQRSAELINGNWSEDTKLLYGSSNHPDVAEQGLTGLAGKRKVDLVIGGPPCQAYSIAGRAQDSNSMRNDYRNFLFESFIKVVSHFKPGMFVFENVPGILSACPDGIPVKQRIHQAFRNAGYAIKTPESLADVVFSADEFGVPQKRKRVIIIGVRKSEEDNLDRIYESINAIKRDSRKTNVRDAIGHLAGIYPLMAEKQTRKASHSIAGDPVQHHNPRFHNTRDIEIFRKWILDKMNEKPGNTRIAFYNDLMNKHSNHGKYRNLEWDKPSPTIVAHLNKDGLLFIHPDPDQARTITIKEAALLQSFPDDYEFLGGQGYCYKMIGNAVPVLMARKIAEGIVAHLEQIKINSYEDIGSL
jgi:DNA (cytosine-5)-methyltransferase 1